MIKVFAVFDSKAKAYLQPFFARNSAVAVRSFEAAANDERHDFHRFAGDYTLFCIGFWDEESGVIGAEDHKESLGVAIEFLKDKKEGLHVV